MNEAQSRRLRMRCLLLLAPLLLASTPSPFPAARGLMLAAAPTRLVFLPLPPEILKGQCVPVTVEARDGSGAPAAPVSPVTLMLGSSLLGGTFFASSTCLESGISTVVLPGSSAQVQIWFKPTALGSLTLTASDGLFGMTDALSVPLSVVLTPTNRLEFTNPLRSAGAGQTVTVTVTARTLGGFVATGYSGTIHFTSTDTEASLPADFTFTPSDAGTKMFPVTFRTGGTWNLVAQDTATSTLRAEIQDISVRATVATRLEFRNLPAQAFKGSPVSFQVLALDANGDPGTLRGNVVFRSSDSNASLPPDGPLQPSYTVTFNTLDTQTLWVTDSTDSATGATASIIVMGPQSRNVTVTPAFTQKKTCENAKLTLAVTDGLGPVSVSLCRGEDHVATPANPTNFSDAVMTDQCITGSFDGSATVDWVSGEKDDVQFNLYGADSSNSVRVVWKPEPNPELTSFEFTDTSEEVPILPVGTGTHTLQLQLSDTCPNPKPLALPSGALTFEASEGLTITPSNSTAIPGRWVISVTLPNCPADPTQPLAIWPKLNDMELTKPGGGRLERLVQPKCPPVVELALNGPGGGEKVEPGGLVEFEVELANEGQVPVMNGVLKVSTEGLTVLEARLDGTALTPHDEGFTILELLPDTKVKVKIKAQATTNLAQKLSATVWYVDENGAELTERKDLSLDKPDLGVDVGCGCHAASLPGQLLPWLVLLLAASRPWDRSRRLRRGERIGR